MNLENNNMKHMNEIPRWRIYSIPIGIILLLSALLILQKSEQDLEKNGVYTVGTITEIKKKKRLFKRSSGRYRIYYEYQVGDSTYKKNIIGNLRMHLYQVGKKYKVQYSTKDPLNARLFVNQPIEQ